MSRHTASRSGLRRTEVADIHALDEVSFCAPHDPSRTPEHVRRARGRLRAPLQGIRGRSSRDHRILPGAEGEWPTIKERSIAEMTLKQQSLLADGLIVLVLLLGISLLLLIFSSARLP